MRRGFTMLEVLIAVVILAILASVAMVSYQGYQDRVAMMVDATNQKVLAAAVKIYAYDTGALPGSLSDLAPSHLYQAYAEVSQGKPIYTLLAYWEENLRKGLGLGVAEAQEFLPGRYYNRDLKVMTCPRDKIVPTGFDSDDRPTGGRSYEMAEEFRGKPVAFLLDSASRHKTLIFESDEAGSPEFRHRSGEGAVVTCPNGESGVSNPSDPLPPDVPSLPPVGSSGVQGESATGTEQGPTGHSDRPKSPHPDRPDDSGPPPK